MVIVDDLGNVMLQKDQVSYRMEEGEIFLVILFICFEFYF